MTHYSRLFPLEKPFRPDHGRLETLSRTMLEFGDTPEGFSSIPSGYTYLGQFITHDLSLDMMPPGDDPVEPESVENLRRPYLNLDSVYGAGPQRSPFLYEDDGARMRVGWSELAHSEDLPRTAPGKGRQWALIADPRNDENLIVSQLHLAFIKFHNRVVDVIEGEEGLHGPALFAKAAQIVRRHYQWAVVHDYLPRIVDDQLIRDAMNRPRIFGPGKPPSMPVEFSAGAFRFGHSMVRRDYMLEPWFSFPFLSADPSQQDLGGCEPRPPGTTIADWSVLFGADQPARKIDVLLAEMLGQIPAHVTGALGAPPINLPFVDLKKASRLGLPTGQDVARALELPAYQRLTPDDFPELKKVPELSQFSLDTPLWYYCLKEAEAERFGKGSKLGPVGSRIVADVLIGLLRADPASYISAVPEWQPQVGRFGAREPIEPGGPPTFGIRELLAFASGVPTSRREPFGRGLVPVA